MPDPLSSRVLVTGASGFTGHFLVEQLERAGYEARRLSSKFLNWQRGRGVDVRDFGQLETFFQEFTPNFIIHLAAISNPRHEDVDEIFSVNVRGTENILRASRPHSSKIKKIIVASSATVYAQKAGLLDENSPLTALGAYAESKLEAESLCKEYSSDLPIVVTRPFNYTGVGQTSTFVVPKLVEHFYRKTKELEMGNINAVRDFSDVRDIANYYTALLEKGDRGQTYNLCSGTGISIAAIISRLEVITEHKIGIISADSLLRTNDNTSTIGNPMKLREAIHKLPEYNLDATLHWMLGRFEN